MKNLQKLLTFSCLSFFTQKHANQEKIKIKPERFTLSFNLLHIKTTAATMLWIINEFYIKK